MVSRAIKLLPTLASIAVGLLPVIVLIQYFGVSRKLIVGWGVLAYVAGTTVLKMPLYHLVVVRVLHGRLSNVALSVAQGLVSSVSELLAALLFFVFVVPDLNLAQLIGFGVSAGAVEAIMLPFMQNPLKGTPVGEHAQEVADNSSSNPLIAWMAVVERALVFIPHVAARGLVYISLVTGNLIPGFVAVTTFALIDGRAYFAHLEKWPFDQISVLRRLYLEIAAVALFQAVCFAGFYYFLM